MKAVDFNGDMNQYLTDEKRKIPKAHLNKICKIKQGKKTCRYISLTVDGYCCVKKTPIKKMLDQQVKDKKMKAQGDNCEGIGRIE